MVKKELGERLFKLRKEYQKSQADVARELGLTVSAYQNYENGRREVGYETLIKLADVYEVSTDYLLGREPKTDAFKAFTRQAKADYNTLEERFNQLPPDGKAVIIALLKVLIKADNADKAERESANAVRIASIRLHRNKASAGYGYDLSSDDEWEEIDVKDIPEIQKADFAVEVDGDSMLPDFSDGDIVLIKIDPDVPIGKVGLFVHDSKGYIKERGKDRLISKNPDYPDIFGESRCIGLVVGTAERA